MLETVESRSRSSFEALSDATPLSRNTSWDYENRLIGITGGGITASYSYDYQGRRKSKTVNGATTTYLYDGQNLIRESSTTTTADYVFGSKIDEPLAESRTSAISYYAVDGLGSVTMLNDSAGTVQNTYTFDAWGIVRNQTGSTANPFGYTSREFAETGLYLYRARSYNAALGRFVSEDPIEDYLRLYSYSANDPINFIDPLGLFEIVNNSTSVPREDIDKACEGYLTAGECAYIDANLVWRCNCLGFLDTTLILEGNIFYYPGKLPYQNRPTVDPKLKYGTPKGSAERHVSEFHTSIAIQAVTPMILAFEATPWGNEWLCNLAGMLLHQKVFDTFRDAMKDSRIQEHKGKRPKHGSS